MINVDSSEVMENLIVQVLTGVIPVRNQGAFKLNIWIRFLVPSNILFAPNLWLLLTIALWIDKKGIYFML